MKWIDPRQKKPEGKVFWALTEGRDEVDGKDWVIRKLVYTSGFRDYRSLDYTCAYFLPDDEFANWCTTIHAWLPLEAIEVEIKQ
jgi:hypothetical protein